jgi:hypothetical protein
MLCVLVVPIRATNNSRRTPSLSQHSMGARLAQLPQRHACVFDGVRGFCEYGEMYQLLHLAGEDDMVTNCLSSLALDLELGILALVLKEGMDIADHGECFDIVIDKLKPSERGLQWMCEDSECTFCHTTFKFSYHGLVFDMPQTIRFFGHLKWPRPSSLALNFHPPYDAFPQIRCLIPCILARGES